MLLGGNIVCLKLLLVECSNTRIGSYIAVVFYSLSCPFRTSCSCVDFLIHLKFLATAITTGSISGRMVRPCGIIFADIIKHGPCLLLGTTAWQLQGI